MAATWRSLAVAVLIALPACAPKPIVDPVSVMTDRSVPFSKRRTATEQARLANPDDPRRIKALHHVLWERGYPSWQRTNAVDELATHDETAFRDALRRRMILLRDRETLEHIFDLADEGGWTDLAPAIVRCYARRSVVVKDDERVERAAIERLHPDRSVEQVIFDVFSGVETGGAPVEVTANWKSMVRRERIAAWTLLARLVDAQELGTSLDRATTNDTLVSDMQAARRDLDIVPVQREGILRLQSLREPAQQAFWDRSVAVVSALRTDQRAGLDLRHLPLLVAGG
ncbi:MAG: hypothetical protein CMJ18_28285, partial [Phycisphaeraceae bacterium]|nr:hypothetical protein [Phycisphaeraceae bacterium]